jgi:formylglycine-generating enzyme required for sulfatase activity
VDGVYLRRRAASVSLVRTGDVFDGIADTPVTQALWQTIMGDNPSEFKENENPVENVSWNDAQAFIAKMNGMKAELKLCLPTEAQWEYACRAGTAAPFSWGEQIDTS